MVGGQIADACKKHKEARAAAAAEATLATAAAAEKGTGHVGETAAAETPTAEGAGEARQAAAAPAAVSTVPPADELKFAAVVDPPRSGVHAKCLRSIRSTKAIKRLVRERQGGHMATLLGIELLADGCRRGFL